MADQTTPSQISARDQEIALKLMYELKAQGVDLEALKSVAPADKTNDQVPKAKDQKDETPVEKPAEEAPKEEMKPVDTAVPVDKSEEANNETNDQKNEAPIAQDNEIHDLIHKQEYWTFNVNKNVVVIIGVILLALIAQLAYRFLF